MEEIIHHYKDGENIITVYQEYSEISGDTTYQMPTIKSWRGQCQYKRVPRARLISISRFFPCHNGKAYIKEWNKDTRIATFEGNGPLLYKGIEVGKLKEDK